MPSYEYKCKVHGQFEVVQSIKDPPLEQCEKCVEEGYLEYFCTDCKLAVFVVKQDAGFYCPDCEKPFEYEHLKPTRLISKTSFQLSGSGWAKDNYGK